MRGVTSRPATQTVVTASFSCKNVIRPPHLSNSHAICCPADRKLPKDCQMLLFSATFEDSVWQFAERIIPDPNIIRLKREEETLDTIKQYYVLCRNKQDKFDALCNIYGAITIAQAMIFCHVRAVNALILYKP